MDTSTSQFYPTVFPLDTDIMDMLGDMVWERIRQKAEFSEYGTKLYSLPGPSFYICFLSQLPLFIVKLLIHCMQGMGIVIYIKKIWLVFDTFIMLVLKVTISF